MRYKGQAAEIKKAQQAEQASRTAWEKLRNSNQSEALDAYNRLAGEAEARAVEARMNLNAAQRRALFPLDSYDVPVDQLIVRGLID